MGYLSTGHRWAGHPSAAAPWHRIVDVTGGEGMTLRARRFMTPAKPNGHMDLALCEAEAAAKRGEVPVGAVVTGPDGAVISAAGFDSPCKRCSL